MDIVKAEKISYSYPDPEDKKSDPALNGVAAEVKEGQFICVLGRNGSGKSTLARHLNALLVPTDGTLWIDGMNSKDENLLRDIRKTVGIVFQNPDNQIIGAVVEEDVAFGPENLGVESTAIRAAVSQALVQTGMGDYAKHSPDKLSGGQKQRTAIAGVLAMNPKCIVLDEATAMLDPRGRQEVMNTVRQLNREKGITIILITHFMEEAIDADFIFVMDDGAIRLQGKPKDIFSKEEEIEELGLRLPQICQLAKALRNAGWSIPRGILTAEELKKEIQK